MEEAHLAEVPTAEARVAQRALMADPRALTAEVEAMATEMITTPAEVAAVATTVTTTTMEAAEARVAARAPTDMVLRRAAREAAADQVDPTRTITTDRCQLSTMTTTTLPVATAKAVLVDVAPARAERAKEPPTTSQLQAEEAPPDTVVAIAAARVVETTRKRTNIHENASLCFVNTSSHASCEAAEANLWVLGD